MTATFCAKIKNCHNSRIFKTFLQERYGNCYNAIVFLTENVLIRHYRVVFKNKKTGFINRFIYEMIVVNVIQRAVPVMADFVVHLVVMVAPAVAVALVVRAVLVVAPADCHPALAGLPMGSSARKFC